MPFPPLTFGATADPIATPTAAQISALLGCGPLDLGVLNGLLKLLADRVDAIDAADNAIVSAGYNATTNELTFTMADGPPVVINMAALIADSVATGIITGSSYNAVTNILTLTTANGDAITIDMTAVLSDTVGTALIPTGGIIMWSGSAAPSGWALCDGSNGTPDLRDRFVIGAGGSHAAGDTGGSISHDHGGATGGHALTEAELAPHHHYLAENVISTTTLPMNPDVTLAWSNGNSPGEEEYELSGSGGTSASLGRTGDAGGNGGAADSHSHGIGTASNMPPFYALAFIMKL